MASRTLVITVTDQDTGETVLETTTTVDTVPAVVMPAGN